MLPIIVRRAIAALFFSRKISRVLNLVSTGTNHENYVPKKKNVEKNYDYPGLGLKNKNCCHSHAKLLPYTDKSTHAEEMAIDKLPNNRNKKLINVSLLVIRISVNSTTDLYKMSNSRPCISCMYKIKTSAQLGYKISKIYFSNEDGDIVCHKLRDIIKEKQFLSKYYRLSMIPKVLVREFEIANAEKASYLNKLS